MSKIVFILFLSDIQHRLWNKTQKNKFISSLKKIGEVYICKDKTENINYYDLSNKNRLQYDKDIDFDLSYININNYGKMIYKDVKKKYKNHRAIVIGNGIGAIIGAYYSVKYNDYEWCILLEQMTMYDILNVDKKYVIKSNAKIKELLNNVKKHDIESIVAMKNIILNIRKQFFIKHMVKYFSNLFNEKPVPALLLPATLAIYTYDPPDEPYIDTDFEETQAHLQYNLVHDTNTINTNTKYAFDMPNLNERIIKYIKSIIAGGQMTYFYNVS